MRISGFQKKASHSSGRLKSGGDKTGKNYILSLKDEVSIGGEDARCDEGWKNSSKLQEFAEQQKQENISLRKEVERLKKELEAEKLKSQDKHVDIDLEKGKFTLKDIKYKGLNVEKIVFTNPKIAEQMEELSSGDIFSKNPGEFRDDFFDILNGPFVVREGRMKFSEDTLTELLNKTGEFKKHKIKNLKAKYEDGKCRVKGDYGGLISVPFSLDYGLSFKNNRLNIKLDKVKVAGLFSLPSIVQDLMVGAFSGNFEKGIVQYDDKQKNTFFVDVGAMLPIGLKATFTKVKAENGTLAIDLGPPGEKKD